MELLQDVAPQNIEARYHSGELKSALQKFIRRGQPEESSAVATALIKRKGNTFFRRLSAIAVEDVGPEFGALVFEACKDLQAKRAKGEDVTPQASKLVQWLSKQPKDKDAAGLARIATILNEEELPNTPLDTLGEAIRQKNLELSVRLLQSATKNGRSRSAWDQLTIVAESFGNDMKSEIKSLHSRSSQGLMPMDELIFMSAGVLRISGYKEPRSFNWEGENGHHIPLAPIPWFVFDSHTIVGKIAYSALRRDGLNTNRIGRLQWFWESVQLDQPIGTFYQKSREMLGFENTKDEWKKIRPQVKEMTIWAMRKRDLPVPSQQD